MALEEEEEEDGDFRVWMQVALWRCRKKGLLEMR
jgi:hypothetical protein